MTGYCFPSKKTKNYDIAFILYYTSLFKTMEVPERHTFFCNFVQNQNSCSKLSSFEPKRPEKIQVKKAIKKARWSRYKCDNHALF